jgi:hypothetical protein
MFVQEWFNKNLEIFEMNSVMEGSGMGDVTDDESLEISWEERGVLLVLGALTILIAITDIQWVVSKTFECRSRCVKSGRQAGRQVANVPCN